MDKWAWVEGGSALREHLVPFAKGKRLKFQEKDGEEEIQEFDVLILKLIMWLWVNFSKLKR